MPTEHVSDPPAGLFVGFRRFATTIEAGRVVVERRAWAASLAVARIVLAPRRQNRPAIAAVPVDARTDWGVALFADLVSATPGST